MTYITQLNIFKNHRGIELHQEVLISGELPKGRCQYVASVAIKLKQNEEDEEGVLHPINTEEFDADNVEDAFIKAEPLLQKAIKEFEEELKQAHQEINKPKLHMP